MVRVRKSDKESGENLKMIKIYCIKITEMSGVVAHAFNPTTQEAEAGECL